MQAPFAIVALAESAAPSPLLQLLPILIIFGIFYFLLIAPMRKRQKALEKTVSVLKKGDKVVTTGGLLGEIAAVEERLVVLRVGENVKLRVLKSAIAGLESAAPEEESK